MLKHDLGPPPRPLSTNQRFTNVPSLPVLHTEVHNLTNKTSLASRDHPDQSAALHPHVTHESLYLSAARILIKTSSMGRPPPAHPHSQARGTRSCFAFRVRYMTVSTPLPRTKCVTYRSPVLRFSNDSFTTDPDAPSTVVY